MSEEKEMYLDRFKELEEAIDKSGLKRKLIMEFSKAVFNTDTIEDLMRLVYRTPVCNRPCRISYILNSIMNEYGLNYQYYVARDL